jgi:hypothetical protein
MPDFVYRLSTLRGGPSLWISTTEAAMAWGKSDVVEGAVCQACQHPIAKGQAICECGRPTVFMSFTDRAAFEVAQYKAWKERQPA